MHGILTVNAAILLILSAGQQFSPAVASLLTGCGCAENRAACRGTARATRPWPP